MNGIIGLTESIAREFKRLLPDQRKTQPQIQHSDRLARLLLVMAVALYIAVSTGQWDAETNPVPAEKKR